MGNGEVRPEQSNVEAVENFPRPESKRNVHSFRDTTEGLYSITL